MDVGGGHQLPETALVDVALAYETGTVEPEALEPPVEVESGRGGPDEEQCARLVSLPHRCERLQQLRHALARVHVAEGAEERLSADVGRRQIGNRERGVRDDPDRPLVARRAGLALDVPGVDNEAGREIEHLPREVEVLGAVLPQRRDALIEDSVTQQPPDDPALALHCVEVAVPVAAADRETGDEMVEDEVVEDDDARCPAQRLDDPAVSVGIVADVVNTEIGSARRLLRATLDRDDFAPRTEGWEQER